MIRIVRTYRLPHGLRGAAQILRLRHGQVQGRGGEYGVQRLRRRDCQHHPRADRRMPCAPCRPDKAPGGTANVRVPRELLQLDVVSDRAGDSHHSGPFPHSSAIRQVLSEFHHQAPQICPRILRAGVPIIRAQSSLA